jgi:PAS domain S-box-containing protein
VTEYLPERRTLRALAFVLDRKPVTPYEYAIDGTPCAPVVDRGERVHIPDCVVQLYPADPDLARLGAVSYMGVPLRGEDGAVLGHLALLDRRPMPEEPRATAVFRIFAARAAAELRRLRADAALREREAKLRRVFEGALDAILELDRDLRVTIANPAAAALFGRPAESLAGADLAALLTPDAAALLRRCAADLDGRRSVRVPGGLRARDARGALVPAEATLSAAGPFRILVLRDAHDRLDAEALRDEVRGLTGPGEIVGASPAIARVLREVREVAETDATVLVLGETGTGKELVARAIHAASRRRDRPLVTVNCGAIPASLVESEFFGHVKGAFTGATERRAGRFALADGGTIFLDEVGELPLELQVKLLRVLQEGEFEPVGSSEPRKVDVRVIAATNRDLLREVREGRFRADLYYRLEVFPIRVPPLRERGDDVVLLAAEFARRFAAKMRRALAPLSSECARRLRAYAWPGNVRELENVIERAVITARDGRLDLERAIPDVDPLPASPAVASSGAHTTSAVASAPPGAAPGAVAPLPRTGSTVSPSVAGGGSASAAGEVRTEAEMREIERANLLRALEAAAWKVAGPSGAAARLGVSPSTLRSRMKSLGIRRPGR